MSTIALAHDPGIVPVAAPVVDVVVPTHDEAATLEAQVRRLHAYLAEHFPFTWCVTIADNGSTDGTPSVARRLAAELPGVRALVRRQAGRGGALRQAWTASDATVVAYMDVDLSTDLGALLPLVAPLLSGHSDVAIGSRLATGARTRRGAKREVISRCYNALLHLVLRTSFRDAQCGFKALRADTARALLPAVADDRWFFDTELLVAAQRRGLRIVELPVDWTDDPDSRVRIVPTAVADLRGVWRLLVAGRHRHLVRFAAVGVASTVAYVLAFLALRPAVGPLWANAFALGATTVANTAVNRRWTFGVTTREGRLRHQVQGAVALAAGLLASTAGLALLHLAAPSPAPAVEAAVALAAGAAGTAVRYLLFRHWIFATVPTPQETLP
ncbi:MAG TPA: glycosyltransferase [Acidimicrobiales bacterium]|nr:glycosyltransferase [Acidimicrobiales bacterium]